MTPERRLLILDTWRRSGMPAGDFAVLVGVSKHILYSWKKQGRRPGGPLGSSARRGQGSKLPDLTKRAVLMMKEANPDQDLKSDCTTLADLIQYGDGQRMNEWRPGRRSQNRPFFPGRRVPIQNRPTNYGPGRTADTARRIGPNRIARRFWMASRRDSRPRGFTRTDRRRSDGRHDTVRRLVRRPGPQPEFAVRRLECEPGAG